MLQEGHPPRVSYHQGYCATEMCSGSEAGSYWRLVDSCITQLKVQGPSRTCNESKEDEEATADNECMQWGPFGVVLGC